MILIKILLSGFFLITFLNNIIAQIKIDGNILDSDSNPIENALVEITDQNDTTNYYSAITNRSGYFSISNITEVISDKRILPNDYIVLRNYPNPFNPTTIIYYELPKSEKIEIKIYDILGRQVRALYNNFQKAGIYTIEWNGRNNWNSPVSAGVYFCRLKTKDNFKVNKMVLLDGGSISPLITNSRLSKIQPQRLAKVNNVFNYSIKVSGENILETEFNYLSCSTDTTLNLMVPKILQSVTIGPEGGKLENDDFSLTIPAAAFNSEYEIKLFKKTSDEWDDDIASQIFGLEGLPSNFNIPLDINITPTIELTGKSYITIGQDYELPFLNSSETVYKFLETNDTLGVLAAKLFPDSNSISEKLAKGKLSDYKQNKIYFTAKTGFYSNLSYNKHFKIFVNVNVPQDYYYVTKTIGNLFENNFDLVKAAGFDTVNIKWPVEVYVKKLKDELYNRGCIYYPTYGSENMSLLVDQRRIDGIIQSSIREYAIGISRSYDKHFFLPHEFTGKVNPDRYWFHHAVGSWFEEKTWIQNDMWFIPIDYNKADYHWPGEENGDNSIAPFFGMVEGAGNNSKSALKHGGGMSTFIKYLDINYGEAPILNVYQLIRESDYHPIQALKTTLSDSYVWWPEYLEKLINDELYRFNKNQYFEYYDEGGEKNIFEGGYDFKDKNDTIKVFKDIQLTSLSAKAFYIGWNSSDIDTSRIIDISQNNNDNILFVYGGTSFEHYSLLGKGVSFKNEIKELLNIKVDEEYIDHLVIIVTNAECESPYTNKSNLSLKVLLKKKQEILFNHCKIRIRVCCTQEPSDCYWDPSWYTDGTFKDNVFTGTINSELQGGNATGSIEVQLDDYHNIISLSVMAYSNAYGFSQWGMSAGNLTPTTDVKYGIEYKYYGNAVCNYVTSRYAKAIDPDGYSSEESEYSCNENSILEITFSYW